MPLTGKKGGVAAPGGGEEGAGRRWPAPAGRGPCGAHEKGPPERAFPVRDAAQTTPTPPSFLARFRAPNSRMRW